MTKYTRGVWLLTQGSYGWASQAPFSPDNMIRNVSTTYMQQQQWFDAWLKIACLMRGEEDLEEPQLTEQMTPHAGRRSSTEFSMSRPSQVHSVENLVVLKL